MNSITNWSLTFLKQHNGVGYVASVEFVYIIANIYLEREKKH